MRPPDAMDLSEIAAQLSAEDEWSSCYEEQVPFFQGQYNGAIQDFESQADLEYWESDIDPPTLGALV